MRHTLLGLLVAAAVAGPAVAAEKKVIRPPEFPATWPFSPGLLVDGTLYVSGQTGIDLKTLKVPEDFDAEVKQCLENVGLVLRAAGMGYQDVFSVQIFLTDMEAFKQMNAVYRTFFKEPLPTRTTAGAARLAGKARIEITVMARR